MLLLTFFKHYPHFNDFANNYGYRQGSSAEKLIKRIIDTIWEPLYNEFVKPISKRSQHDTNTTFNLFPEVAMVVDVTFQPCYRPGGRFFEARHYWSGKHWQYGIKTEVAVAPNGIPCAPTSRFNKYAYVAKIRRRSSC